MPGKMTKKQAYDLIEKAVSKNVIPAWDRLEKAMPRLGRLIKQLDGVLKKAESPEMVDMLIKGVRLDLRPVAEGAVALGQVLAAIDKVTDDPEVFALVRRDLNVDLPNVTANLERARNMVREGKLLLDRAERFLAGQGSDADSAGEAWSIALTEFERITAAAMREAPAWMAWERDAKAALETRNAARLDKLRKARPGSAMLDTVVGWPRDKPFADFDRSYKVAALPKALREEIERDRAKAVPVYAKAMAMALACAGIASRVKAMAIEPLDGRRGLAALGLPKEALARLQAALESPDSARLKALEALARAHKVDTTGKEMVVKLQRSGVL